ncbi:hypothetical protein [Microvirga rosea]|uniref:hypothetical protein n=1 Tax=Microvirga rosea TaxID=2715425 RepID=UPI001D0A3B45|nr:hypothetical protein [Microvirga rosea]MCB8821461.1 hypothetical protein [Microvirga rosea]
MLGITVADAVAVGTLVIAVLAAWRGARAGETAKKIIPMDPPMAIMGAAIVDSMTLRDLVEAVKDHATAIREAIKSNERLEHDRLADAVEELKNRLEPNIRDRRR